MNQYVVSGNTGRFLGLVQCLLYSTVSFTLVPELLVQRAEENDATVRPSVLRVTQIDSTQILVLYVLSVVAAGLVCPYNNTMLTNKGAGAGSSPFVVAVKISQIQVLPMVVTILIFLSSVASGRSFLFLSSRLLCSLAEEGHAPPVFKRRNRFGVPYVAVLASGWFAGFAYLSMATSSSSVFNWLMHFLTTSGYISWLGSCVIYLHFRRTVDEKGFTRAHQTRIQPYGVYFGILVCSVLPIVNGLITASFESVPSNLLAAYLGIIIFLLLYLGHRVNSIMRGQDHPKRNRDWSVSPVRRMFSWMRPERTEEIELGEWRE